MLRTMTTIAEPIPEAAVAALQQGNKIEAIKIVRTARALGLKESKDAVEAYVQNNPELQQSLSESNAEAGRKLGLWFALLAGAGLIAWFLLKPR
jgi:ribosomal protein L7/L12